MAKLKQFDPPAFLEDMNEEQKNQWSDYISTRFDVCISEVESEVGVGKCQFYNPVKIDTPENYLTKTIRWKAFPKLIADKYQDNWELAYKEAEETLIQNGKYIYRPQDEYCEWHVERDEQTGRLKRVTFTCEGEEYWKSLDQDKIVELYNQYIKNGISKEELFMNEEYNPYNAWNTEKGKMHLTHESNTLSAEINIAARATVLRIKDGNEIKAYDELIECSDYGNAGRASDPLIGGIINDFARDKYFITIQNPVALYIDDLDTNGWKTKSGTDPKTYWKIIRGQDGSSGEEVLGVRAVYEIPDGEEVLIDDKPIRYGGQVARFIDIKLTGIVCRKGEADNVQHQCPGNTAAVAEMMIHPTDMQRSRRN
ncbi:hypothetical protein CXK86_13440 [Paenibacillus sp. BGI2013]|uniref:hypothetical protein n=1 Tax=Paenibacillus TaxID=44249 RepID=UPI0003E1FF08|nr:MULTISPECIES: hypothetical protein [Paenibacillus]ETT31417.1 hypothetical protein C161_25645 [Paenibacillus sp. FSL R5-192]OMF46451.1 hypothetical protein BK136_07460 [Paenibacillus amylolyticus]PKQ91020.1 hypothetical protein CXK86_13440 [Paenibacillus sp. BGI2013]